MSEPLTRIQDQLVIGQLEIQDPDQGVSQIVEGPDQSSTEDQITTEQFEIQHGGQIAAQIGNETFSKSAKLRYRKKTLESNRCDLECAVDTVQLQ